MKTNTNIFCFNRDFELHSGKKFVVLSDSGKSREDIIEHELEMLLHNRIPGLAGLSIREKDLEIELLYNITGLVSLANYFKRQRIAKAEFVTIIERIMTPIINNHNYFLNDSSFVLTEDLVYINPISKEVSLIYIPVEMDQDIGYICRNFVFDMLINKVLIDASENFIQKVLSLLREELFSISDFLFNLRSLDEIKAVDVPSFNIVRDITPPMDDNDTPIFSEYPSEFRKEPEVRASKPKIRGLGEIVTAAWSILRPTKKSTSLTDEQYKVSNHSCGVGVDETVLLDEVKCPYFRSLDDNSKVLIDNPTIIIGRNKETCDRVIDNRQVGRAHAEIRVRDGNCYVLDLDSRNGTFVEGERLVSNKEYLLKDGMHVGFADVSYTFHSN